MLKKILCTQLCALLLFGFLLGVCDGKIAIWRDGEAQPWRTFPYPVAVVPAETQAQLRQGIRIDTLEDLDALLENLLS